MRYRLIQIVIAGSLLIILTACSGGDDSPGNTSVIVDPIPETSVVYEGNGTLQMGGGTIIAGDVNITIPADAILKDMNVSVYETAVSVPLPSGFKAVDNAIEIDISDADQAMINAPFKISLNYDDTYIDNEKSLLVLHFNDNTQKYDPVRIISLDTDANVIVFDSKTFSPFILAVVDRVLSSSYDSGFRATENGWDIRNFGSYFSPGGNCFGMSAFATWHYNNRSDLLHDKYSDDVSTIVITRAHLAQNQSWGLAEWRDEQQLGMEYTGRTMKAYMSLLERPLILLSGIDGSGRHAMVVYKYDADKFYFYDVNFKDTEQSLDFNGTAFGTYGGFNSFGFCPLGSVGRFEDFADLTVEAEAGFLASQDITLTSPLYNEQLSGYKMDLNGTLSGELNSEAYLYVDIRGTRYEVPVESGLFSQEINITEGESSVVVLAGVDFRKQSLWAKNSATVVRTVYANSTVVAGVLDTSFGGDGIVTHHNAADGWGYDDYGWDLTIDDSGNVYVTGESASDDDPDMIIWKYKSDGTLDTSFSGDGIVVSHNAAGGGGYDIGRAIALDNFGNIYVAGSSLGSSNSDMALWKYKSDGTLDTTFGTNGIVVHDNAAGGSGSDSGLAIVLDSADNIYVAGTSNSGSDLDTTSNYDMVIWKYDSNGTLDTTFDTDGIVLHNSAAGGDKHDGGYGIVLDSIGKIYVTGYSSNSAIDEDMVIWKYDSNGTLDMTFDTNGIVVHNNAAGGNAGDMGHAIAVDSTDNIYVTGKSENSSYNTEMVVWKYTSNGILDTNFDGNGIVLNNGAAGALDSDTGFSITVDSFDNAYVTGASYNGSDNDMVIWKYKGDGTLDTSFSTDGIVTDHNASGGEGHDNGWAIALDNTGKVYVTGRSESGRYDMAIWKYK